MTKTPNQADDTDDTSVLDGLKDKSLKTAGYAYLVGDGALFAAGLMKKEYKEASAGLLWGLGGLACARYGNPSVDKQLELMGARLGDYLQKENVAIPENPTTEMLTKDHGIVDHVEAFLYKYPSQMLNTVFTIGGVQLAASGLKVKNNWTAASGALIAAGTLAGLLVQEKKPDPEHPPQGAIGKALAWLQEKPLRISSGFFAVNNVAMVMSGVKEFKTNPGPKTYLLKFLTASTYIFANAMLAMSSKHNHGAAGESNVALEKLADAAAQVIAAQPAELREALIEHIAAYLSAQPEVHEKADELSAMLHEKLKSVGASAIPGGWEQKMQNSLPAFSAQL